MINNRHREKLLNALIYFSGEVMWPGKTKLYKLLHYLDFLHYHETGRSVTGLEYYAWEKGPVPKELHWELEGRPNADFIEHLLKEKVQLRSGKVRHELKARKKFREELFSPFELELMAMLAKRHMKDNADQMSEESHFKTGPWHQVREVESRKDALIPYEYVLYRKGNAEDMNTLERAKDFIEFEEKFAS